MGFVIDEDTLSSNLDTKVPTQQSVKAYVDSVSASDISLQGDYNAFTNSPDLDSSPSGVKKGDHYVVSTAGTFFTEALQAGDSIIAKADDPTTLSHWILTNNNLTTPITNNEVSATANIALSKLATDPVARANHTGSQAASTISDFDTEVANNSAVTANTAKVTYPTADSNKLAGIEASATADQTNAEIKAAVEAATDSNTFTDADHTKLNAIEASATIDQTGAEIKTLYEAETSAFTDTQFTKLAGIETSATADQTDSQIKTAYEANSNTNAFTDANVTTLGTVAGKAGLASPTFTGTVTTASLDVAGNNIDNVQNIIHDLSTASTALDFSGDEFQNISISANTTFTASNYAIGKSKTVIITTDSTARTLAFPSGWTFLNKSKPVDQAASKIGVLSLVCTTAIESGVLATYAAEDFSLAGMTASSTSTLTNKTINTASNTITVTASDVSDFDTEVGNNSAVTANTAKVTYPTADSNKLAAIEASATADQTDAEIRAAVEAASDSNVFTDTDHTKLNAIEASATADQTDAEIRTAVGAATDSNVFTDANVTSLGNRAPLASPTFTGTVTTATLDVAGNNIDNIQNIIHDTSATTNALDFNADQLQFDTIDANTTFTTTNRAIGRSKTIKLTTDGSTRTFTFPAWKFVGAEPSDQAANKVGILTLTCFGSADSDIVAAYAVEE